MSKLRDVVVVRVSEKGDREDEHFHSPEVQIEAARRWAKDRGERLADSPIPEIDVSGRLPLSKRPGSGMLNCSAALLCGLIGEARTLRAASRQAPHCASPPLGD